jgi:hypothetical protein
VIRTDPPIISAGDPGARRRLDDVRLDVIRMQRRTVQDPHADRRPPRARAERSDVVAGGTRRREGDERHRCVIGAWIERRICTATTGTSRGNPGIGARRFEVACAGARATLAQSVADAR